MTTDIAAKLLHYELMKRCHDMETAKNLAFYFIDTFMEGINDLEADNIKAEQHPDYDGYGNLMGYLTNVREKLSEL